jgi:hypothetical protein
MIARLANVYVRLVFALSILAFVSTLAFHISVLIGANPRHPEIGKLLEIGNMYAMVPIIFFAKDRNVWSNEFKSCPLWMREVVAVFAIYGFVAGLVGVALAPGDGAPLNESMQTSSFFTGFDAVAICIPYSVIWAAPLDCPELIKRARNSFIAVVLIVIVSTAWHVGFFGRSGHEDQTIESQPQTAIRTTREPMRVKISHGMVPIARA